MRNYILYFNENGREWRVEGDSLSIYRACILIQRPHVLCTIVGPDGHTFNRDEFFNDCMKRLGIVMEELTGGKDNDDSVSGNPGED